MNVLMVGAGAVGQVYARHLQRGGAEISFFVREKYRAEMEKAAGEKGLPLFCRNRGAIGGPIQLRGFGVVSTPEEVVARSWDVVWLCVSSPALAGTWLGALLAAVGSATVITLQPGLEDRAILLKHVPEERLVSGMIPFTAWPAPLPGEKGEKHLSYWLPPFSKTPFDSPAAAETVKVLKKGSCGAKISKGMAFQSAMGSSVLLNVIASLECAGWSFSTFRKGDGAKQACAAAKQAMAVSAAYLERDVGFLPWVVRPILFRLATLFAPIVVPFDLEGMLKVHFSKVGDQTLKSLDTWIRQAGVQGLPADALTALQERLRTVRTPH